MHVQPTPHDTLVTPPCLSVVFSSMSAISELIPFYIQNKKQNEKSTEHPNVAAMSKKAYVIVNTQKKSKKKTTHIFPFLQTIHCELIYKSDINLYIL